MEHEIVSIDQIGKELNMPRNDYLENLTEGLQSTLSIPSVAHTFSLITEFIAIWFQEKFPEEYFKYVHIADKHMFEEYRTFDISKLVTKELPLLAIAPKINLSYDRDMLDTNQFGVDYLIRTGKISNSYIRDFERNLFIGGRMEQLDLEYDIRIRVESRAQQIDLYKRLSMLFPMGHTMEETIYLDYQLPYGMMMQLAQDAGFEIKDNMLVEPISFVNYVNKHSRLPVVYKYRTINGKLEFFMRFHDVDLLIDLTNMPDYDDGDRRNKRNKFYNIDIRVGVKAPSPKFFIYYSSNKHELINLDYWLMDTGDTLLPIHMFEMKTIPKINEKGWNQHTYTEYVYEENSDKTKIDLTALFDNGDLHYVLENIKNSGLNPDDFVEIYAYNGDQYRIKNTIDWETYVITFEPVNEMKGYNTLLSLYVDTEYTNTLMNMIERRNRTERLGKYELNIHDKK